MTTKLKGICRYCKNASTNVYGEYCTKATFRDHGGGYGQSWVSNECQHDQHQRQLVNLFEPAEVLSDLTLSLGEQIKSLQDQLRSAQDDNDRLRRLV